MSVAAPRGASAGAGVGRLVCANPRAFGAVDELAVFLRVAARGGGSGRRRVRGVPRASYAPVCVDVLGVGSREVIMHRGF